MLTDAQWAKMAAHCPGKPSDPGRNGADDRRPVEQAAHPIENFFCKLKEFKRIAQRDDKIDQSVKVMIYLAAAIINSR